jgi:hypothetical protein
VTTDGEHHRIAGMKVINNGLGDDPPVLP